MNSSARVVLSVFVLTLVSACGDDSTAPVNNAPEFYSRMIGGDANVLVNDVAVTTSGVSVVTGSFSGTTQVSGWSGSLTGGSAGDIFVLAFKPDGKVAWARVLGGDATESVSAIAHDAADNLYVGGAYFGPDIVGGTNLLGYGSGDALLARLDPAGNPLWVLGDGSAGFDAVNGIALSSSGEVLVCGVADGEMHLAGEDEGEAGHQVGFVVKMQSDGSGTWALNASGTGSTNCSAIARAADGTILVAGYYLNGNLDIYGETLPNDGGSDGFIARLTNSTGVPLSIAHLGGNGDVSPVAMTHIGDDPVVVGVLNGFADFDVTAPGGEEVSAGGSDAFIARYSPLGALRWVRKIGSGGTETALDVCRIGTSDILVIGPFDSPVTIGNKTLISTGDFDMFLARLDADGRFLSVSQIGGPGREGQGAITSTGETAIVVGRADGEITFPNGTTRDILTLYRNAFVAQMP